MRAKLKSENCIEPEVILSRSFQADPTQQAPRRREFALPQEQAIRSRTSLHLRAEEDQPSDQRRGRDHSEYSAGTS